MSEITKIPIIKLYNCLIVSIQVSLSDQLVMQLKDDITNTIERTRARGLIMDLSGLDLMDSYISRAIRDVALVANLMGVDTIVSGMDPLIALTLVEMDIDFTGVRAALNLEAALEMFIDEQKKKDQLAEIDF